jgi:hypothetical protein
MLRFFLLLALALTPRALAASEPPPVQTVEGTVVDAVTGKPLAGVQLSTPATKPQDTWTAVSDAAGHFRISADERGCFLKATRDGYLPYQHGFDFEPKQPPPALEVRLTPQAVISGKVQCEDGLPAAGATIRVYRYRLADGRRDLDQDGHAFAGNQGDYRLSGLEAGQHYLRVDHTCRDARYWPEYYGNTLEPLEKNAVTVQAGQELTGIDLRLKKREGVTVSGRVVLPPAIPNKSWKPWVDPRLDNIGIVPVQPDGSFVIRHVPPGICELWAGVGRGEPWPETGEFFTQQKLRVGKRGLSGVVLVPRPFQPLDLSGVASFVGGRANQYQSIDLDALIGGHHSTRPDGDGSFAFHGLLPDHFRLTIVPYIVLIEGEMCGNWTAVSARLGGREVLRDGFDLDPTSPKLLRITMRAENAIVQGKVVDRNGKPVPDAVVIFSGEPPQQRTANEQGTFGACLLPGDYRVYAVRDEAQTIPPGPHRRVHLAPGNNPSLTLTLR